MPTACANPSAAFCTPPSDFVDRLCAKPHQGTALALFSHDTPFTRLYVRGRVDELLPALDGPCLHSATCMYSNTPDQNFVIARHPDRANVTVACGFSGHGFKFASVIGELAADLVGGAPAADRFALGPRVG